MALLIRVHLSSVLTTDKYELIYGGGSNGRRARIFNSLCNCDTWGCDNWCNDTGFWPKFWEMLPRSGPKFPFLKGEWDAIWYVDEGSKEKLYIKNTLKLTQRGRSVRGVGRDASGHGDYVLKGRFNSHGVVTMAYEYKDAAMAGSDIES
jgi:hypothetical protein